VVWASTSWPRRWRRATAWRTCPSDREGRTRELEVGAQYQWRREGEVHLFNPKTVFKLQHATRAKRYDIFKEYTKLVDDQATHLATLRGLLGSARGSSPHCRWTRWNPLSEILKRFRHGRHVVRVDLRRSTRDLAIAMNRLGGKSNTGEGGEDADRYVPTRTATCDAAPSSRSRRLVSGSRANTS